MVVRIFSEYGFIEIYLSTKSWYIEQVRTQINTNALNTLTAPPAEKSQGFFTAQLVDGKGDADLHVTEPEWGSYFITP